MRHDPDRFDAYSEAAMAANAAYAAWRDIILSGAEEREALLGALLCAAWPSRRAQNQ